MIGDHSFYQVSPHHLRNVWVELQECDEECQGYSPQLHHHHLHQHHLPPHDLHFLNQIKQELMIH